MRLRLLLAVAAILLALASAAGAPLPAGADTTPPPTRIAYFPVIVYQPTPTPTMTPTPTRTATPSATATATATQAPSGACAGDEEISFSPDPGSTGSAVTVHATSFRGSVNVVLRVFYGSQEQTVAWVGVTQGGKGFIWSWSFTPAVPGQYTARFYVDVSEYCAGRPVQVNGEAIPTATPTTSPVPSATPTPTATRVTSDDCGGDEEISFVPDPGATGSSLAVSVTSAQPSANVVLQVLFQGASQAVAWQSVVPGGKGYIWTWTVIPYQPGWYEADFFVENTSFCAVDFVQVQGTPIATPTGTRTATRTATPAGATPTPTRTPTRTPTPGPQPGLEWDWRLTFLNIQITRTGGSPRWSVVKGIFQNHIEGGGGHAIAVELLDAAGNRMNLPYDAEVGFAQNGGTVALHWTKLDQPYPVVYDIYGGLGSYSIWMTANGLASDRISGMGLVASDGTDAPLLAEPGKVHVNFLFTFRMVYGSLLQRPPSHRPPEWLPPWLLGPRLPWF